LPEALDLETEFHKRIAGVLIKDLGPEAFLESSIWQAVVEDLAAVASRIRVVASQGLVTQSLLLVVAECGMCPVLLADGVLLVSRQLDSELLALNNNLLLKDPVRDLAQMLLGGGERQSLIDTELDECRVLVVLLGLLEEELSGLLVETRHGLRGQVSVLGHDERAEEGIDQVLVLLIKKLVHDQRHTRSRVLNLPHHRDKLTDDDSAIDLALHLAEFLLEDFHGSVLHGEVAEAPVIRVKKHGAGNLLANHSLDRRQLLAFNLDVLNLIAKLALIVVKRDVDTLLAVH